MKNKLFQNKALVLAIAIFISLIPFLWLLTQTRLVGGYLGALANISGLIGATLMLWQFVLGIRFINRKLSLDLITLTKFHIFLGSYGLIAVFIHPFAMMLTFSKDLTYFLPDLSSEYAEHVTMGRGAFYLFVVIWILSALLRKRIPYRYWLKIHYITYPMMGLVFIHAREIGTFLNRFPLLQAYWLGLAGIFGLLTLYRSIKFLNIGKPQYELIKKDKLSDGVTQYIFKPIKSAIIPKVGQFVFIRPKGLVGEAHPFSVMKFNQKSQELTFGIKAEGKFTRQLENLNLNSKVYIDGPYGVFTKEGHNSDPKIIIAGGIGITPFVELVNRFGMDNTLMFYANKTLADAVNRSDFKKQLGDQYIDVVSREKIQKDTVINGRIEAKSFLQHVPKEYLGSAKVFICGSAPFMSSIRSMLLSLGFTKDLIFMEEFSL